jgi:hypothetical protein
MMEFINNALAVCNKNGNQLVVPIEGRPQQLVPPRKRQMRLTRHTRAGQYPHPAAGRAAAGHLRQRRLPDPRIADYQQRAAAVADTGQQQLHRGDLRVPPDQL